MNGPIGVFDSGVGGLSVLKALRAELPAEDFVYLADTAHAPYGERSDAYVIERTRTVVRHLRGEHAIKALVVACNTATAAAIHLVRAEHPDLPLVGIEPALKPAVALSKTRRIAVLATRVTTEGAKLRALHDSLKDQAEFILQPCDGLADAIERGDDTQVDALCRRYAGALSPWGANPGEIDTVVLGCTHYVFAQEVLRRLLGPEVRLVETGEAVARHTRTLLSGAGLLNAAGGGHTALLATAALPALEAAAARWF